MERRKQRRILREDLPYPPRVEFGQGDTRRVRRLLWTHPPPEGLEYYESDEIFDDTCPESPLYEPQYEWTYDQADNDTGYHAQSRSEQSRVDYTSETSMNTAPEQPYDPLSGAPLTRTNGILPDFRSMIFPTPPVVLNTVFPTAPGYTLPTLQPLLPMPASPIQLQQNSTTFAHPGASSMATTSISQPPSNRRWPCPLAASTGCRKSFKTEATADQHLLTHTGKKDPLPGLWHHVRAQGYHGES